MQKFEESNEALSERRNIIVMADEAHRGQYGLNEKVVVKQKDLSLIHICTTARDLAMIDLLVSSGMRVGELVTLNREDINFNERECVVIGKGNKERLVYFCLLSTSRCV